MALLNFPNHSCHSKGLPSFWVSSHSGRLFFFGRSNQLHKIIQKHGNLSLLRNYCAYRRQTEGVRVGRRDWWNGSRHRSCYSWGTSTCYRKYEQTWCGIKVTWNNMCCKAMGWRRLQRISRRLMTYCLYWKRLGTQVWCHVHCRNFRRNSRMRELTWLLCLLRVWHLRELMNFCLSQVCWWFSTKFMVSRWKNYCFDLPEALTVACY